MRRPGTGGRRRRALALLAVAMLVLLATASAASASATSAQALNTPVALSGLSPVMAVSARARLTGKVHRSALQGISLTRSATKPHWACPEEACDAIVDPPAVRNAAGRPALPDGGPALEGGGENGGLDPQDLQSAYKIPSSGGSGQTVAIVDAYGYQTAEADLGKYRERYGLAPCTHANGCFRRVNQVGEEANYPVANEGWETESALDIEMASAGCPECHILLVEGDTAAGSDLSQAEDTAVRLGATEISNSYSSPEEDCWEDGLDLCEDAPSYDHPGVLITAAGGDNGYDNSGKGSESPNYPASLPSVVAVGGTSLHRAANARGWSEAVWGQEPGRRGGSGSGCSMFPKPPWQQDPACAGRMTNDVAAVGACESPVSVFYVRTWENYCGTSVASPLVAAIEAHSSEYARSLPGADAFYQDPGALFDVTAGSNGQCAPPAEREYFCTAQGGYDGPTGNGTPDGALELTGAAPSVGTRFASAVTGSVATLHGTLDPQGSATTYRFEYGTTTPYGTSVPVPEASAGSGTSDEEVSEEVTGLSPQTTYHYRLLASSAAGTSYGADRAFTTALPAITSVEPAGGPIDGGGSVTISGSNFTGATAVHFGASAASSFAVGAEGSITATAPVGHATVDVTVTTPAGTSASGPSDLFSYRRQGDVLTWGENYGALGDGQNADSELPVEASGLSEATALAAGESQSLAVLANGRVMAWGENGFGQVGDGTYAARKLPVGVCAVGSSECPDGPYLEEAAAVAAGRLQSLALLRNGTVVAWGGNYYGDLASDTARSPSPVPVCTKLESPCKPENVLKEVAAIAAGSDFSLALLRNGTVMAWGENVAGELGVRSTKGPEKCGEEKQACSRIPVAVSGLSQVAQISAGTTHSLALLKNGTVVAWGENFAGELGNGSRVKGKTKSSVPAPVCAEGQTAPCASDLSDVAAVAAGSEFSVALLANGTVAAWGTNGSGELGDGATSESEVPVAVKNLSEVTAIASGDEARNTLALLKSGELVTWGSGASGALGDGASANHLEPVGVCATSASGPCPEGPYLAGEVTAIAAGGHHDLVSFLPSQAHPEAPSVVTGSASSLSATSATLNATVDPQAASVSDCHFEYGPTTAYGSSVPCSSLPGSGTSPVSVSASVTGLSPNLTYHFRAVATNSVGTAYGADSAFATALPTVTVLAPRSGPPSGGVSVTIAGSGFVGVTAVRFGAAAAASFKVESEASISATAPAGSGEVDVTVTTLAGTSAAGPADGFEYLPKAGAVLAWGGNDGRLGDARSANSDVPVEAGELSEPEAVAAGTDQSFALLQGGELVGWGENAAGDVGDGSAKPSYVPVGVCAVGVGECPDGPYLQEVAAVSAGSGDSLALLKNGTVLAWGVNGDGQLGDGTTIGSSVPVHVCVVVESPCSPAHYLTEVTAISDGAGDGLAVLRNGTVVAWGRNEDGSLGDKTTKGPERCDPHEDPCSRVPVAVTGVTEAAAVAAGSPQNLVLLRNGTVMSWGLNKWGSLSDGSTKNTDVPKPVCEPGEDFGGCSPLSGVEAIAAGPLYNLALLRSGTVVSWGRNEHGQLGDGTVKGPSSCDWKRELEYCSATPVAVSGLSDVTAIAAGVASTESLALLQDGGVMSWGGSEYGELGDGTTVNRDIPGPVCALGAEGPCPAGPDLQGVTSIAVGGGHDLVGVEGAIPE